MLLERTLLNEELNIPIYFTVESKDTSAFYKSVERLTKSDLEASGARGSVNLC